MGRVSRYRKIKACDPFAKRKAEAVDLVHDEPPEEFDERVRLSKKRKRPLDWDNERDRERILQQDAIKELRKQASSKNSVTEIGKKLESKRPDETMKDFMKRIRQETRKTLMEQKKSVSSTAQKRKLKLKEKKLKRKLRKKPKSERENEEEILDFSFAKRETIRFGERVDRPPDLSAYRGKLELSKAKSIQRTTATANSQEKKDKLSMQSESMESIENKRFRSIISGDSLDEVNPQQSNYTTITTKSTATKDEIELLRLKAQQAYKDLKAKRILNHHQSNRAT